MEFKQVNSRTLFVKRMKTQKLLFNFLLDIKLYNSIQKINSVKELKTHEERISEVANSWLSLSQSVRERTLVLHQPIGIAEKLPR